MTASGDGGLATYSVVSTFCFLVFSAVGSESAEIESCVRQKPWEPCSELFGDAFLIFCDGGSDILRFREKVKPNL